MVKEIVDSSQLDQILDDTYPLWGEGLSRHAYGLWHRAQGLSPWGQQRVARVGLVDGGEVLVSARRYLFDAQTDGRSMKVLGIGAVFAPERHRGQNLASALIEAMINDGRDRGCEAALLFSTIGPDFYARMGFKAVQRSLATLDVPVNHRGAPAVLMRAAEPHDLPELAGISMLYADGSDFALNRSAALIEFGVMRRRTLAGLGPLGLRSLEFFVTEEGHRAVAYVVISHGPGGTVVEECGDRDPTCARVGAMLEVLAAREPSHTDRTLRTSWPSAIHPPQIRVLKTEPAPELMMVRAIDGPTPDYARPVYWPTDVF